MKDKLSFKEELNINSLNERNGVDRGKRIVGVLYEEITLPSGNKLFKKVSENHTTIGGTQELLKKYFDIPGTTKIKKMDEDPVMNLLPSTPIQGAMSRCFGFALSTDGASNTTVKKINRADKGFDMNYVVPFRVIKSDIDRPIELLKDYSLRSEKTIDGEKYQAYYIKKIKSMELINKTVDGEILPDYPGDTIGPETEVESLVELRFSVTKQELREYFALVEDDVDKRRMSSLMLVMGVPVNVTVNGTSCQEFRNIIVSNKLNIKERTLGTEGELAFVYKIYAY